MGHLRYHDVVNAIEMIAACMTQQELDALLQARETGFTGPDTGYIAVADQALPIPMAEPDA